MWTGGNGVWLLGSPTSNVLVGRGAAGLPRSSYRISGASLQSTDTRQESCLEMTSESLCPGRPQALLKLQGGGAVQCVCRGFMQAEAAEARASSFSCLGAGPRLEPWMGPSGRTPERGSRPIRPWAAQITWSCFARGGAATRGFGWARWLGLAWRRTSANLATNLATILESQASC